MSESPHKGYVMCKCDCGNIHEVRVNNLTRNSNPTTSCGCRRKETSSINGRNNIRKNSEKRLAMIAKYGTNVGAISSSKPYRNNKSGYRGVWYDSAHGIYQAYITFKNKKYHLGTFRNLNEAINARQKEAERLFAPILKDAQTNQI